MRVKILTRFFAVLSAISGVYTQASGSALDLAQLNAQMMNTKCAITPCQSACLVRQPETGCYVCSPACGSGNVGNIADGPRTVNSQSPAGQSFYRCATDTSWVQCPVTCDRDFSLGCFQCICNNKPITASILVTTSARITKLSTNQAPTVNTTVDPTFAVSIKTSSTSVPTSSTLQHTMSTLTTHAKADDIHFPAVKVGESTKAAYTSKVTVPSTSGLDSMSASQHEIQGLLTKETKQMSNFDVNDLTFILFAAIAILIFFVVYFVIVWYKTKRKLRRNKDELYFVEKAHRQDSNRLRNIETVDPVYATMTPQPPPRPNRLSSVHSDTPLRTLSVCSDTTVKECFDDGKHDYLELI